MKKKLLRGIWLFFLLILFLEIRFKSNPLKDNRLKKLMEQDKIKAVLEYLGKQWNEQQKNLSKSSQNKSKDQQQEEEEIENKIEVLHFDQPGDLKGKQSLFKRILLDFNSILSLKLQYYLE